MNGYQVDAYGQFTTAVISAAAGGFLCLLYDLLRLLRYAHRPTVFQTFVQDVLWWLAATLVAGGLLLTRCSGTLRSFALIGLLVGFLAVRFTLSLVLMKAGKKVIDLIKGVTGWVWNKIFSPILNKAVAVFNKMAEFIKNFLKSVKNLLKDSTHVVYNLFVLWARKPRQKEQ